MRQKKSIGGKPDTIEWKRFHLINNPKQYAISWYQYFSKRNNNELEHTNKLKHLKSVLVKWSNSNQQQTLWYCTANKTI